MPELIEKQQSLLGKELIFFFNLSDALSERTPLGNLLKLDQCLLLSVTG